MTRGKAPDADPCRCEFRWMMWGVAAAVLAVVGAQLISHAWVARHLYLAIAIAAIGCVVATAAGFGMAFYYQCLMRQNKR
jgi:hypothetical protein